MSENLFKGIKDFYPTPVSLTIQMIHKLKDRYSINSILDPSAGAGHILKYLKKEYRYKLYAIEINPTLQKLLMADDFDLIDSDFLAYDGLIQFDAIIANFPFSDGDKHLLKAIDLMFSGQIVCLINAETIRNPYSNTRKELASRLEKLGAEITFLKDKFIDAERKTSVEVAMIHIIKEDNIENHLTDGLNEDKENIEGIDVNESDVDTIDDIYNLVQKYNKDKELVVKQMMAFYSNYSLIGKYMEINLCGESNDKHYYSDQENETITDQMKRKLNAFSFHLKSEYWKRLLSTKAVDEKLPYKHKEKLLKNFDSISKMEFSEKNIAIFVKNLALEFEDLIGEAVEDLFDMFTQYALKDSRWGKEYERSIHYFNAWKSNSGYKVNKKVIIPFYHDYSNSYLCWDKRRTLDDMDKVINYFSDSNIEIDTSEKCDKALKDGDHKKIDTNFFILSFFKKGTMHIEFKSEETLRLFNIEGCKRKGFLPMDYSENEYDDLKPQEKEIVKNFEDVKNYKKIKPSNFKRFSAIINNEHLLLENYSE